jgi:putative DNA primase/helicase
MKTADAARNKWRGILMTLGVDGQRFLSGKHGPCPFCEGRDRFRWDNKNGNGSFYCSQCGAGDGFEFLKRLKGWDFVTAAREVDRVVGNVQAEASTPASASDKDNRERMRRLWESATPLAPGDPAHLYLSGRVKLPSSPPKCLRYAARCPMPEGRFAPALLAQVLGPDGKAENIHRTSLHKPAEGERRDRAVMPGNLPEGSAIRLFPVHGARLGIAEGIETALAAADRFGLPVWSAINSTLLAKWQPPSGVEEVVVFGDSDAAFGGQAAAYALAHRLATRCRLKVEVRIPQAIGLDWADSDAA